MFTKEEKADIDRRLRGIKGKGDVFNAINQGASHEDVETMIADLLAAQPAPKLGIALSQHPVGIEIFGKHLIANNAVDDMRQIARLPYVTRTALMPDAHRTGEGSVPVGGVVEMAGWIDPEIVSADIACSVMLTVLDSVHPVSWFDENADALKHVLTTRTYFGNEENPSAAHFNDSWVSEYVPKPEEMETETGAELTRKLLPIARRQFGTSGDGNHFVEFGYTKEGNFAILTHFGSRGIGAMIHKAFVDEAQRRYEYPKGVHTAALPIGSPLGHDYYLLMRFAGRFAEAGHSWLHRQLTNAVNSHTWVSKYIADEVYSLHNFAWMMMDGSVVHRKGATPIGRGTSVIPATMGHQTQIVMGMFGKDTELRRAMFSVSHGAGRTHSRGQALQAFKGDTAQRVLNEYGVHLIGAGADEDDRAYKPIEQVMKAQSDLCTVVDTFTPKIVRMAPPRFQWQRGKKS